MCGRYSLNGRSQPILQERLGGIDFTTPDIWGRFNICPSNQVPVLHMGEALEWVPMVWGFVPSYVKEEKPKSQPINARIETVATNGYFRSSFRRKRCLVPATGYYEWQLLPDGKHPRNMHLIDEYPFLLAGIWDTWNGAPRMAILTRPALQAVAAVHDRMPVLIDLDRAQEWLTTEEPEALLNGEPGAQLLPYEVSRLVNSPRNQGEALIAPIATTP